MPVYGSDTPVGAGMIWYTDTAPNGWLIADGSSLSTTAYPKLFAVLGTTYGSGGAGLFNLPDLRQRFPMGKAASGTGNTIAGTGGTIDHTHTSAAHTHSVPAHYHGMGTGADLNVTSSGTTTTNTTGSHNHTMNTRSSPTGFGAGSLARASATGTLDATYPTASDGSHSHTVNAHTHAAGDIAGRIGLVTGGVDGNAAMTSGSTTPGATGSNNPPYLVVNYIIKAA